MPNILTPQNAANALRCNPDDPRLLDLLPQVDQFIKRATGRDWAQDSDKHPVAVSAATMLVVIHFENPGVLDIAMPFALSAALAQLEAEALAYRKAQFYGLSQTGGIAIAGACVGDQVISLQGVYGVSGSQLAKFESVISKHGQIQQTAGDDLSANLYVVVLKSPQDDILP